MNNQMTDEEIIENLREEGKIRHYESWDGADSLNRVVDRVRVLELSRKLYAANRIVDRVRNLQVHICDDDPSMHKISIDQSIGLIKSLIEFDNAYGRK